jgi:chitodextrinase
VIVHTPEEEPVTSHLRRVALVLVLALVAFGLPSEQAQASLPGGDAQLTRAPYLSDVTSSSVQVSWGTSTQSHGVVRYGPPGNCTANSVSSVPMGNPITVNGVHEYQNGVAVTGLSAGTAYCYRVYTDDSVDLLGSNASPQFATLEAAGSGTPFTFGVFGDWGDTTNSGVNDGTLNANQAGVDAQIAASGIRFAISTGDIGYPGGTQTNYGDLNQTGVNISGVFGPSFWAVPGQSVPVHGVSGNHGLNSTFLSVWPQVASTAASGGVYAMTAYPSFLGSDPGSYPTSYYAFTTGGVRFYVLEASWSDGNVGNATGGPCGSHCRMYEVDQQAHWTVNSAEYQWLAQDLAAHPGGVKMAAFHFPLHSDDSSQPSDVYLQNTPGSTGSVEQLLHDGGVQLLFNGHSHTYQRFVSTPGGVTSYVSGGGGAKVGSIGSNCSSADAYAIGWSHTKQKGNACGAAPAPTSDSQVYHFLKVTVNGSTVTVTPTDSQGNTFDVKTYNFGGDAVAPSAPGNLTASLPTSTKVALSWTAASDNVGVTAYDIYRNDIYLATTTPGVTSYTDATVVAGAGYTYDVIARDLQDNTTGATVSVNGGGSTDTTPPTTPGGFTATATGPTTASLSWTASTDNVAVSSYTILRGGAEVASVPANTTSWNDSGLTPGTAYTYQVVAKDSAGNASPPTAQVTITTQADTSPPTQPGTPTATLVTASQVSLSWSASTDDVGVLRYDVLRNGSVVGTSAGTTFTDTTVAPGTTYTYAVRAFDAAGNFSTSGSSSVTTPVSGSVFYDGFESGGLAAWNTVSGLTVQGSFVNTGAFAARETSTGSATYAYKTLPGSYSELWAQSWVYVSSRSTSANLFGFRTSSGASIVNVYLDTNGRVSLRNNAGGVTTYGTTTIAPGGWHRVVLHAFVNSTSSSMDVFVDGAAVPGLTLTGQNLGTSPIAKLQLGETSTGRTYDIALDDVTVSQNAL